MDVAIDGLDEGLLTVSTPIVFDLEVKLHVILNVAALVLPPVAYFTDENLFGAAGVMLNDILNLVQGVQVDFFVLHAVEEAQYLICAGSFSKISCYGMLDILLIFTVICDYSCLILV